MQERLRLGALNDLVFCREDGKPWEPDAVTRGYFKLIKRCEVTQVRFHDLRHSHATQLLKQGVNPKAVSERLGHSTVGMTLDTYSHVLPDIQEEAANKVDNVLRTALGNYRERYAYGASVLQHWCLSNHVLHFKP
jgi:site-specific recombinase XerD